MNQKKTEGGQLEEPRLRAARVAALFAASLPAYYGAIVVGGVLLIALWDAYPSQLLAGWFGVLVGVMLMRAAVHWAYKRFPDTSRDAALWERRFALATLAAGAVWTYVPVVLFPEGDPLLQTALVIIVGGVIIAGAALCAASPAAVYGLITLPLVALITQLMLQPDRIHRLLAVAVLLFGFVIVRMCREIRRSIVEAFQATLHNETLLERVEQTETRLRDAIESCPEGIAVWDAEDRLLVCNESYARMYGDGSNAAELVGTPFVRIVTRAWETEHSGTEAGDEHRRQWIEQRVQLHREGRGESHQYQARDRRWRQGSTMRMRGGGWVGLVADITELKEAQQKLRLAMEEGERREEMVRFLAYHDALTGLPNRRLLDDRLRQAVFQAQRRNTKLAAMLVDLDDFKQVNDSAGHRAGDAVLREVAMRLGGCVRKADTIARHGGDEFVIVIADLQAETDCRTVAEKILRSLATEFQVDGAGYTLGASIGISIFPADAGDADVLLRNADAAMYRAKQLGKNHYRYYGR